jgi:hypothetical protein
LRVPQTCAVQNRKAPVNGEIIAALLGIGATTLGVVIRLLVTTERRLTLLEERMRVHEELLHPVMPRRRPA